MTMRIHERKFYREKMEVYRYYDEVGRLIVLEEPLHYEVYDISLGGLGVLTKSKPVPASVLEFTLYLNQVPYRVMAKVAWYETNQIYHRYGLEFIGQNNMMFRQMKEMLKSTS